MEVSLLQHVESDDTARPPIFICRAIPKSGDRVKRIVVASRRILTRMSVLPVSARSLAASRPESPHAIVSDASGGSVLAWSACVGEVQR